MPVQDIRQDRIDLDRPVPAPRRPSEPTTSRMERYRAAWDRTPGSGAATTRVTVDPPTYRALGFAIATINHTDAVATVVAYAREGRARQVHLCNQYTLTLARRDEELARALEAADLNLPDGAPIAWLGRKAGTTGPVRGPALTRDVFSAGVARDGRPGIRHYLYGGGPGVADAMAAELRRRTPGVEVVGRETPPFRPLTADELQAVADRINDAGADIVWIGLGTPRQDHLVAALAPLVDATLVPVGAAFDYVAGRVAEAPSFLHGTGFEWLYRLLTEPRRLWRRYLVDGVRFACYAMTGSRRGGAPASRGPR